MNTISLNKLNVLQDMQLQIQSYIQSYIQSVECMNHLTAEIYSKRINKFNAFAKSEYRASADKLIEIIKNGQDPYNTLFEG